MTCHFFRKSKTGLVQNSDADEFRCIDVAYSLQRKKRREVTRRAQELANIIHLELHLTSKNQLMNILLHYTNLGFWTSSMESFPLQWKYFTLCIAQKSILRMIYLHIKLKFTKSFSTLPFMLLKYFSFSSRSSDKFNWLTNKIYEISTFLKSSKPMTPSLSSSPSNTALSAIWLSFSASTDVPTIIFKSDSISSWEIISSPSRS